MQTCFICKQSIPDGEPEIWRHDSGEAVSVETSANPCAVIDTEEGELWVCERCYLEGLPTILPPHQLQSLHEQFAIEYRDWEMFNYAIRAGERALELGETADVLAGLAYAHSKLGHHFETVALYRSALAIDPNHFMATENLKRLLDAPANG